MSTPRPPRAGRWLPAAMLSIAAAGSASTLRAESLSDAWAMAQQSDGMLAAVRSEREAAEADHFAARRQRWPAIDLNGAYTQFDHAPNFQLAMPSGAFVAPLFRRDGYAMAGADVSVPLWTSGKISGSIGAASAGARAAGAQEVGSTADLKLAVTEAYLAVFRAQRALNVADSNVSSLKAHAEDVQAMYDKQTVAQSDLLGATVALANATQHRLRADNALRLAKAAYNRWVGQPLDREPQLEEPQANAVAAVIDAPLDELLAQALDHRPELAGLKAQQEGLEQAARAERAQGLPQLALHAGYNHIDNQILDRENFASVGVGFQWRLFDSGELRARASALRSRARAAGQRLTDLQSSVRLEVETAVFNQQEASARIHAASAAVAQAHENVRIARELYDSGLGTNNQVLDAEALRVVATTNLDDAKFDMLLAQYRLQRAIGTL